MVGNWAATGNGHTRFTFAVPEHLASVRSVKVVGIGRLNRDFDYTINLSHARDMELHYAQTRGEVGGPITAVEDELIEIDVTGIFDGLALDPGTDHLTLRFESQPTGAVRVVGLRFQFEVAVE